MSQPVRAQTDATVLDNRVRSQDRGQVLRFTFDGEQVLAHEGETVAAALLAASRRAFRRTQRRGEPRGLFCGMGVCFDCLVCVDGRVNVRACQVPVAEGMRVQSQQGSGPVEGRT
jgi:predicted molibdopterin-dependent oxidoreductase YjgC